MSRGPGRWQRAILEALKTQRYVSEWTAEPRPRGRSQRFAFRRAAERLAAKGLVTLEWERFDLYVTQRENSAGMSHLGTPEVSVTPLQNS